MVYLFFFFKQKTAYEMRISDWSSDVCSSDLAGAGRGHDAQQMDCARDHRRASGAARRGAGRANRRGRIENGIAALPARRIGGNGIGRGAQRTDTRAVEQARSEEHTSELQTLMRNTYAVFCLKKQKIDIVDSMKT